MGSRMRSLGLVNGPCETVAPVAGPLHAVLMSQKCQHPPPVVAVSVLEPENPPHRSRAYQVLLGQCTCISGRGYPNTRAPEAPLDSVCQSTRFPLSDFWPRPVRSASRWIRAGRSDLGLAGVRGGVCVTEWPLCPKGAILYPRSTLAPSSRGRVCDLLHSGGRHTSQPRCSWEGPSWESWRSFGASTPTWSPFPVGSCDLTESRHQGYGADTRREAGGQKCEVRVWRLPLAS